MKRFNLISKDATYIEGLVLDPPIKSWDGPEITVPPFLLERDTLANGIVITHHRRPEDHHARPVGFFWYVAEREGTKQASL